jgi:hypothetical protein
VADSAHAGKLLIQDTPLYAKYALTMGEYWLLQNGLGLSQFSYSTIGNTSCCVVVNINCAAL